MLLRDVNPASRELLFSYLDGEQRRCYEAYGHFYVVTPQREVFGLCNGYMVIQMYNGLPRDGWNVWGVGWDLPWAGDMRLPMPSVSMSQEQSLITQLLFLQTEPYELIHTGCNPGVCEVTPGLMVGAGCPPMRGQYVEETLAI